MAYTLEELAPGSYDVLLDGIAVASLVRDVRRDGPADGWLVELLDDQLAAERPSPFVDTRHLFASRSAALAWLGITG